MKTIGLFEAKTRLSEICREVQEKAEAVLITRRGRALVRIEPVRDADQTGDTWSLRREWIGKNGPLDKDLALPRREIEDWKNPLEPK